MMKFVAWLGVAALIVITAPVDAHAQASEPLKPYVVFIMDTSGSMDTATGAGPTSCGFADTRRDHAKCAINNITNSYGDMVFGLGRFRMVMGGAEPTCTLTGAGDPGTATCNGTDDMFELLTPLVDGNNQLASKWTDGLRNGCNASALDPEIWATTGNTPLAGSLTGVKKYWLGQQATTQTIWAASNGLTGGYDPITADPTNRAFLARPGTGTSVCNANVATCDNAMNCTGANCCCLEQCRPYIVILLTDGDETCVSFSPNVPNAASSLLSTDKDVGDGITRRYRVKTKAIALGKTAPDPEIESIAHSGGRRDDSNPATREGYYAQNEAELQLAISQILDDAIRTEVCNNLDDDCDTLADEGFNKGAACTNGKKGKCLVNGATACRTDGTGTECQAGVAACEGKLLDAACSVANAAGTTVAGTCLAGNPKLVCVPTPASTDGPTCNNIDDDCDGIVDENATGCVCQPTTELCNGVNDDCDAATDEGTVVPCNNGTCLGVIPCNGASGPGACTAQTPDPLGEHICNNLDDNCDGVVDGFQETCSNMYCPGGTCTGGPVGQRTCTGGTRAGKRCDTYPALDPRNNPAGDASSACKALGVKCICNPGNRRCTTGAFSACVQEIEPATEVCNGLDDDCDGKIDETPALACSVDADCPAITPDCDGGACHPADCSVNSCGGELLCVAGVQMCTQSAGVDDTCNGVDEDCDLEVDEGWQCDDPDGVDNVMGTADDCGCSVAGQCSAHQSCENGSEVCMGDPVGQESCNCADDDCDGKTDEGSLCGPGATCTNCQCAFECSAGEFPCPTGKRCNAENFCVADPCFNFTCPTVAGDKQVCRPKASNPADKECVSACDPTVITCPSSLICFLPTGECRPDDCSTFPDRCAANENCINGACVGNPCDGVSCEAGQYCNAGTCYGSCADVTCLPDQRCELGSCVANPCGKACPFGQVCNDASGECKQDPCGSFMCPQGQWCNPNSGGNCEDDPCAIYGIVCADGEVCRGGTCYDATQFLPDAGAEVRVTTGGGGGCSTTGDFSATWLVGLGLVLALRRRTRVRLVGLAMLLGVSTNLACNVNDYCLNCATTGDGGVTDGGSDADGDGDIGDGDPGDGGCTNTGVEVCDDKDNDCDGEVDEGQLPTIGDLCDNQVGECAGGVKECTAGVVTCTKPARPEECDLEDNNCNGLVDEGDPGGGALCGTNTGECVAGVNRCQSGAIACVGAVGAGTETCNNRDDDCDGMFDENLTLGACVAGQDGPAQGNTGECNLGTRQCVGGVTTCTGATGPVFEQCDTTNQDSDCDGNPSNGYNLGTDPSNCGACGNVCNLPNAFEGCATVAGAPSCTILACAPNFFNNDGVAATGCEFNCGHPFLGAEVCNGIDDDCDGLVDTADPDLVAPVGLCDTDGACSTGTNLTCDAAAGWRCHYSNPNVQTQTAPTANNTVIVAETKCDGDIASAVQADNDCDGRVDEAQANIDVACDNGSLGDCRSAGTFECNPADRFGAATCKFTTVGTGSTADPELCDGRDNNCNGTIDEGAATGNLGGQQWSSIPSLTPKVQIMTFEASRPDATATEGGTQQTHVCARSGAQPWTNITHQQAENACASVGARLCTEAEWQTSCEPTQTSPTVGPATTTTTDFAFVEAESFTASTTLGTPTASRAWARVASPDLNGVTAMQVPDVAFVQGTQANALTQSSRLDYRFTLTASTNYRAMVRMRATSPVRTPTQATATLAPVSASDTQVGDLVIVATWTNGTADPTHTLQSGFTQLVTQFLDEGTTDGRLSVAYKIATAAGAQTYQAYSASQPTNISSITVIKAGRFDMTALTASTSDAGSGPPDPPSAGTTSQASVVLAIGAWRMAAAADNTVTPPGSYIKRTELEGTSQGDLSVATRVVLAGADANPGGFADTITPTGTVAATVAIAINDNRSVFFGASATNAGAASTTLTATAEESWQWVLTPQFTTAAGQTNYVLSLYTREDGVLIDTIAVARHTTLPTFVNYWAYATSPRTSQPTTCNGDEYDTDGAATGDQDAIIATGALASCYAEHGTQDVYDLSGNVKEWTAARAPGQNPLRGGASNNEVTGLTCKLNFTIANEAFFFPNVGFRCCRADPNP